MQLNDSGNPQSSGAEGVRDTKYGQEEEVSKVTAAAQWSACK